MSRTQNSSKNSKRRENMSTNSENFSRSKYGISHRFYELDAGSDSDMLYHVCVVYILWYHGKYTQRHVYNMSSSPVISRNYTPANTHSSQSDWKISCIFCVFLDTCVYIFSEKFIYSVIFFWLFVLYTLCIYSTFLQRSRTNIFRVYMWIHFFAYTSRNEYHS